MASRHLAQGPRRKRVVIILSKAKALPHPFDRRTGRKSDIETFNFLSEDYLFGRA